MNEKVNLRQGEYETMMSLLKELHSQQYASIREFIRNLNILTEYSGGFYAVETSEKMRIVLEQIESQILPEVETLFKESEEIMSQMVIRIQNADEPA